MAKKKLKEFLMQIIENTEKPADIKLEYKFNHAYENRKLKFQRISILFQHIKIQQPKDTNKTLPDVPFRLQQFQIITTHYNAALYKAGYNQKITYIDKENLHIPNKRNNNNHVNNNSDSAGNKSRCRFNVTTNLNGNKNKDKNIDQNIGNSDRINLGKTKKHTISNIDKENLHIPNKSSNNSHVNNNRDHARNKSRSRFTVTTNLNGNKNNDKNIDQNIGNTDKINLDKTKKQANKNINKHNDSGESKNDSTNPNSNSRKFNKKDFVANYKEQALQRSCNHPSLKEELIFDLQDMLHANSSYIRSFKYTVESAPPTECNIVIDADKKLITEHRGD
ncbi:GATA zinc finger domain-containing protein 14-like [Octopus sinensis]|uniref:GATA zinc finger domain-containing protein 14-like n=1 Tax=Octopus sinensis TaxID=2607531 RepID=A0A7E6EZS6_9MOLL|nr:GATA zinc finger domain-containing protein 14-like [Octopus sinensis]